MHRALVLLLGLAAGFCLGYLLQPANATPTSGGLSAPREATAADVTSMHETPVPAETAPAQPPQRKAARQAQGGASVTAIDHDPRFGTLLYGMATSRDGTPIESCSISFSDPADRSRRRSASVDAGAGYALTGLEPGTWKVYSKPTNHAAFQGEIEITGARTQRYDIVFEPSYLIDVKVVTPDGRPIHEAMREANLGWNVDIVCIGSKRPIDGESVAMTDLRGHTRYGIGTFHAARGFEARGRDPKPPEVAGTLELSEPPPIHVAALFRHVVLASKPVSASDREVLLEVSVDDLRAATSTIRVQVVDGRNGAPIEGARVSISDRQSGGGGRPTDAQGRITLEHEIVGVVELDVWAKDCSPYHQVLRITPGEHDLGQVRMYPEQTFELLVNDSDGQPAAGASVHWQNLDLRTWPHEFRFSRTASVDADGKASLPLGPGRYWIQASLDGKSGAMTTIDTGRVAGEPIRLVLEEVQAVTFGPSLEPPRSGMHCLTIYDPSRTPIWSRHLRGYEAAARLPAGRYTWDLHEGTTLLKSGTLEMPKDAGRTIALR